MADPWRSIIHLRLRLRRLLHLIHCNSSVRHRLIPHNTITFITSIRTVKNPRISIHRTTRCTIRNKSILRTMVTNTFITAPIDPLASWNIIHRIILPPASIQRITQISLRRWHREAIIDPWTNTTNQCSMHLIDRLRIKKKRSLHHRRLYYRLETKMISIGTQPHVRARSGDSYTSLLCFVN